MKLVKLVSFVIGFLITTSSLRSATLYECDGVYTNMGSNECKAFHIPDSNKAEGYITLEQIEKERLDAIMQWWNNSVQKTSVSAGKSIRAELKRVIDGDTIEVVINDHTERIRYIGIDCPESSQAFGKEATRANQDLLSWSIDLEFDVQERDRYGRLLAYVWNDSVMINERLVSEGYCLVATYPPNVKYVDRFTAAQKYARENQKGVWEKGGLSESPYEYRRKHKRRLYDPH